MESMSLFFFVESTTKELSEIAKVESVGEMRCSESLCGKEKKVKRRKHKLILFTTLFLLNSFGGKQREDTNRNYQSENHESKKRYPKT